MAALVGFPNRSTSLAQGTAAVALIALFAVLPGCGLRPHHADWVIRSSVEVVGPQPAGGYRLVFPYIVGDFYGSPTTGDLVAPISQTDGGFTLDLNRSQRALESELGPTDFGLRFLKVSPADARLARLTPVALQRDGIEPVGTVEWLDAQSHGPVMLVYVDRPARVHGSLTRDGFTIRYDIRAAKAGYVWIAAIDTGAHDTVYRAVPPPKRLILTITTDRP